VTRRLTQAVRPRDVVARLAGDEFTVLWWEVSTPALAQRLGNRLVQACSQLFALAQGQVTVTCSVGVRIVTAAFNPPAVLRTADLAMYQAKRRGKNQCVVAEMESGC
jgi:diguanylate cyclase (GGDEF)-like protein